MPDTIRALGDLFWMIQLALVMLIGCIVRLTLRHLTIWLRGWPPPHLDADGDWKPEPDHNA